VRFAGERFAVAFPLRAHGPGFILFLMNEITQILAAMEGGDPQAAQQLFPAVYLELRRLAARQLASEQAEHTLSPTALVHEAYLRLVGADGQLRPWNSRGHFFSAAAESMRRILVDSARRKRAFKRGGDLARVPFHEASIGGPQRDRDLLALDEALTRLEQERPHLAQLVKLRYFAGLTMPQAAEMLGTSQRTAERNWTYAKAWLFEAICESET
jgi:RNA polymerase sigma factor (TIGR02999 family)